MNRNNPGEKSLLLRDKWDCIMAFAFEKAAPPYHKKGSLVTSFAQDRRGPSGAPTDWEKDWFKPRAGLTEKARQDFEDILGALNRWLEKQSWYQNNAYAQHQKRFFATSTFERDRGFKFIGRETELDELHERFESDVRSVCISTALTGFGGQGKTALAEEYARRYKSQYAAVIWIEESPLTLKSILDALVEAADKIAEGQPDKLVHKTDGDADKRIAYYLEEIAHRRRGRILIVIDNVPPSSGEGNQSPSEHAISDFLKAVPEVLAVRFRLLLTSRREVLPGAVEQIPLKGMKIEEAIELFRTRSGLADLSDDDPLVVRLVEKVLGGHPLSIALVGTYAKEQGINDVQVLLDKLKRHKVDTALLTDRTLKDYPHALLKSLDISFSQIDDAAQHLLLSLGLFRRGRITVRTLRRCIDGIQKKGSATIEAFKANVGTVAAKKSPAVEMLKRYALIDGFQDSPKRVIVQIQLHEIIYDFVQARWAEWLRDPRKGKLLVELEKALTEGAVSYASDEISKETINFDDVETVSGFLIPIVDEKRGLIPGRYRLSACLEFWFDHGTFQNFIYDTGLQELLLPQLEYLHAYVEHQRLNPRHRLVLLKLLGHGYYADPKATGKRAGEVFAEALAIANRLEKDASVKEFLPEIKWYKVFLLDHRSNAASRGRPKEDLTKAIRNDPRYQTDFDEIEETLPAPFVTLAAPTYTWECELLLRAAHYWGHRGNQDAYILLSQLRQRKMDDSGKLSSGARSHYRAAAVLRLFAIRIFRRGMFERYLAKPIRNGTIPLVPDWTSNSSLNVPRSGYETFTSFSQGVGDTAHQFRGYAMVCLYEYIMKRNEQDATDILEEAKAALKGASKLWTIAEKNLNGGEVLLKYRLWMVGIEIIMERLSGSERDQLPSWDEVSQRFDRKIEAVLEPMKSVYLPALEPQKNELKELLDLLSPKSI